MQKINRKESSHNTKEKLQGREQEKKQELQNNQKTVNKTAINTYLLIMT